MMVKATVYTNSASNPNQNMYVLAHCAQLNRQRLLGQKWQEHEFPPGAVNYFIYNLIYLSICHSGKRRFRRP